MTTHQHRLVCSPGGLSQVQETVADAGGAYALCVTHVCNAYTALPKFRTTTDVDRQRYRLAGKWTDRYSAEQLGMHTFCLCTQYLAYINCYSSIQSYNIRWYKQYIEFCSTRCVCVCVCVCACRRVCAREPRSHRENHLYQCSSRGHQTLMRAPIAACFRIAI